MIDTNPACRPHRQARRRDPIHRLADCHRHISTSTSLHRNGRMRPNTSHHPDLLRRAPQPPQGGIDQPTENLPIHTQRNSQKTVRI